MTHITNIRSGSSADSEQGSFNDDATCTVLQNCAKLTYKIGKIELLHREFEEPARIALATEHLLKNNESPDKFLRAHPYELILESLVASIELGCTNAIPDLAAEAYLRENLSKEQIEKKNRLVQQILKIGEKLTHVPNYAFAARQIKLREQTEKTTCTIQ